MLAGPNTLRRGNVCPGCARLGWLLVLGPDALDVPTRSSSPATPTPEPGPPRRRRGGRAAELQRRAVRGERKRRRREPEGAPQPLPESSRPSTLYRPGVVRELERRRGQGVVSFGELEHSDHDWPIPPEGWTVDEEKQYQKWKARLVSELRKEAPALLKVLGTAPQLEVTIEPRIVDCDGTSLRGRVATLIARGFFREPRTNSATRSELKRTGPDCNEGSLSRELSTLLAWGLLTREAKGWQAVPNAQVRLRTNGAAARV